MNATLMDDITEHLGQLAMNMTDYFPDLDTTNLQWCTQPFE